MAACIVLCSAGGLALAGLLVSQARSLDADSRLADGRSAVTRDVTHLTTLVRQWLVTVDLVTGHNGSYLWEGAQDQAHEIDEQLLALGDRELVKRIGADIEAMRATAERAQRAVIDFAFLDPATSKHTPGELIDTIDEETMQLVSEIDAMTETVEEERARTSVRVAARRAQFVPLASAMSVAYLLLVVGVWRWSVVTLARPIGVLTEEATGHGPFSDPDGRAPEEIAVLKQSLQRFATSLEDEKTALAASEALSRDEAARSRAIMEAAPSAILVVDEEGRILAHNEATRSMLETSEPELTGSSAATFFHGSPLEEGAARARGATRRRRALSPSN